MKVFDDAHVSYNVYIIASAKMIKRKRPPKSLCPAV